MNDFLPIGGTLEPLLSETRRKKKGEGGQVALRTENGVEWDLVNYGAGSFYVASYQDRGAQAPETPKVAVESPDPQENIRIPDCFFYRCWTALRSGCRAA